jgi:hypothetical protein
MESGKKIIEQEIKYNSKLSCLEYNSGMDLLGAGDEKGRLPLFDLKTKKAVKLIKTEKQIEIKYFYMFNCIHLKFSYDGLVAYFSQENNIFEVDLRTEHLIYNSKNGINKILDEGFSSQIEEVGFII